MFHWALNMSPIIDDDALYIPLQARSKPASGPFTQQYYYIGQFLSGTRDIIQCSDWLGLLNLTSYPLRHLAYVISHAFGSTLRGCNTSLGIQNRSASKGFHIVQRGSNNQLEVSCVTSTNTRAPRLALTVPAAVYTDHHHHVVCGCICGCIFGFGQMHGFLFLVYQLVRPF